ncbi:golgin-45 isoform X1 [Eurosta solidaginis]|uniref:golgin-45 isoform X1 n=1 Tax=Eurosta solidaginis TaxID=178769 RepID=UPI00353140B3
MDSPTFKIGRDRTSGDGMEEEKTYWKIEQEESTEQDAYRSITRRVVSADIPENVHRKASTSSTINTINLLPLPGLPSLYRKPDGNSRSLAPTIPKGELVQLSPRLIKNTLSLRKQNNSRLPKFIPYEPYPGATNQIVTTLNLQSKTPKKLKTNKNNLDIGILVEQMSTMRTDEMGNKNCELKDDIDDMKLDKLKDELRTITKERDYYQGQFRFQTQVNSELKNLLVASVGEDLQTHVNVLTEDKLQLARALLDTANNLTTHSEQIEFLAGQCEVWRSKFLASSVMVEELARWKADLTQKNQMLNESTQSLLHTTHEVRDMQLEILRNLKFMAKIRYLNIPARDIVSLSAENLNIIQQMVLHSGVGIPEANRDILSSSANTLCEAEKCAIRALQFVSQPLMATDDAIKALFGHVKRTYGPST